MKQTTWLFYFVDYDGVQLDFATRTCIKPERTKTYKELTAIACADFSIERWGYKRID